MGDSGNFGWLQIATGRTNHSTSLNTEICHVARQTKPIKTFQVCDLFLYSRHLYFQLTSEKKKKYKMLFNVWVACKSRYLPAFVYWVCEGKSWGGHLLSPAKGQNTLGEKLQQESAVSEWQISLCALENFVKIFVSATEFCHHNKSQKRNQIEFVQLVIATKFPRTHKAILRSNVLLQLATQPVHKEWFITGTGCCNLSPGVFQP